ncbi:MAG: hypothetical protein ACI8TQ_000375 [Planctomycetota bacterium]|jgi:hypothetical protein
MPKRYSDRIATFVDLGIEFTMRTNKFNQLVLFIGVLIAAMQPLEGQGTPIGFEENFALATDRTRVLEELIPGTTEYYFYSSLHAQNEGLLEDCKGLLTEWRKRHGGSGKLTEMEMRLALLNYTDDPDGSVNALIRKLGLSFNHRRQVDGSSPNLPTRLDQNLISYSTWLTKALSMNHNDISDVSDRALHQIVGQKLNDRQVRKLLDRLERPDIQGLVGLVISDLNFVHSRGFGSLKIHNRLLLDQLDECARLRPELLQDEKFIAAYLRRLDPGADANRSDPSVLLQHLGRLERFALRLDPAFNSLTAHIRYHRLAYDLAQGIADEKRFLTYLRMPRATRYGDEKYLRGKSVADLSRSWSTGLQSVGNDEALVRAHLEHFFASGSSPEQFIGPLLRSFVERIYAETMILAEKGDMERWYTMLDDPAYYELLKDRVELEFPVTQRRNFGLDETVQLQLDVKNVETLIVKIFEIDTLAFYQSQAASQLRDIDASIDLDGIVASRELTFTYDTPALRRHRREFSFDGLNGSGVWIVDFIGGGISSRAVIRKGALSMLERQSAAGHLFQILDSKNQIISDGAIHFAGRKYPPNKRGVISIPYSNDAGNRQVLLQQGDFAILDRFEHSPEEYRLEAGIHVDRESLIAGETATFLVRPRLSVNHSPAPLSLLENVTLNVTSLDFDGIRTTQRVQDFELFADRASTHAIRVPARTMLVELSLQATVDNLSQNEPVDLNTRLKRFQINDIDRGSELYTALLTRTPKGYALDVLGKNGEAIAEHALSVRLLHRDFGNSISVNLKSDENGRVHLGALDGIRELRADNVGISSLWWNLIPPMRSGSPQALFGLAEETLRVAYEGRSTSISRSVASLLELRGDTPTRDCFEKLQVRNGFIELDKLEPGDYELQLYETDQRWPIHITSGKRQSGWGIGSTRRIELSDATPFQVSSSAIEGDELVIKLSNASSTTRVHVFATRFLNSFDPHEDLEFLPLRGLRESKHEQSESQLASGRVISDEYRYILERRLAQKFPGNMLVRAGTLLNPWVIDDDTDSQLQGAGGKGGNYARRGLGVGQGSKDSVGEPGIGRSGAASNPPANLDFLPAPSTVLGNLLPDENGQIRVPLSKLGANHVLRIVAVDNNVTISRTNIRPETKLVPRDRRLLASLDPDRHLIEKRRIEFVRANQSMPLGDLAFSGMQTLDTLQSVFTLFQTIGSADDLNSFEFLMRWPSLDMKDKFERYSEFASHELNVFLHEKDPQFFEEIIQPYLANKLGKSFIDHWLLDHDLTNYTEPWAFARLNVVERILLLQKIGGSAAENVRDLVELLPPQQFALATYFKNVLASGGLDAGNELLEQFSELKEKSMKRVAAKSGPAAAAPGGLGPASERPTGDAGFFLGEGTRNRAKEADDAKKLEGLGYDGGALEESEELALRDEIRQLFRDVPDTQELAESHYWHVLASQLNANFITPNPFWLDFASTPRNAPFTSERFPLANGSLAEILLALAFLDLPFESTEHKLENTNGLATLVPGSDLFLVRKEIDDATTSESAPSVLVGQDFLRFDDPVIIENGITRDRFVTGEFLARVAYSCRVVVTNPSSSSLEVDLLLQVPAGAIPVMKGFDTRGLAVNLAPYASRSIEYSFYFPETGDFRHYPVHIGSQGNLVGFAEPESLHVVEKPTVVDTQSWRHISQHAETETLLEYLEKVNLGQIDLSDIAWRMIDREVFSSVTKLLRSRHNYEEVLWRYGFKHRDSEAMSELLANSSDIKNRFGYALRSPLLSIDPIDRRIYQQFEYEPLINGRAHQFGEDRVILNSSLSRQYASFLQMMSYQSALDDDQEMMSAYYLALQDRVGEALDMFAKVDREQTEARIQYDYMRVYFDFYAGDLENARSVAQAYKEHPITRWRARFTDALEQLDEASGLGAADVSDPESQQQLQGSLAASEPAIELEVEAGRVLLTYANVEEAEVSYRKMDIELLFSTNPFLKAGSSSFAFVKANRTDLLRLDGSDSTHEFDLPAEFRNSNVLIEVRSAGVVRRQPYYAGDLTVQALGNYGQIRVRKTSTGKLLPTAYVKVYAKLANGSIRFHKDGYTDIRGRFDYASVSGINLDSIEQFAVLVMTEEDGALVRELAPPSR